MVGLYLPPEYQGYRTEGQVPRLDESIDRTDLWSGRALGADMYSAIPSEQFVRSLIERESASAPNELRLRQNVMLQLLERGIKPDDRREILGRAVQHYREARKANAQSYQPASSRKPGPDIGPWVKSQTDTESRRGALIIPNDSPDLDPDEPEGAVKSEGARAQYPIDEALKGGQGDGAHLRSQVRRMLEAGGDMGVPTKKLADFVRDHGGHALMSTLRDIGVVTHNNRIFLKKSLSAHDLSVKFVISPARAQGSRQTMLLRKTEKEQLPRNAQAVSDDRSEPVGARKIWNKRVVEKKPDGKWHVVGHVAGLEDPKRIPQLDPGMLSREQIAHLLRQLHAIHQAGKDSGKTQGQS